MQFLMFIPILIIFVVISVIKTAKQANDGQKPVNRPTETASPRTNNPYYTSQPSAQRQSAYPFGPQSAPRPQTTSGQTGYNKRRYRSTSTRDPRDVKADLDSLLEAGIINRDEYIERLGKYVR